MAVERGMLTLKRQQGEQELAIEALMMLRLLKRVNRSTNANSVAKVLEMAWSMLDGNGLGRCPRRVGGWLEMGCQQ